MGVAFAAGMVAAFNPCGFAMLPAYLTLVIRGEADGPQNRVTAVTRAVIATATMTFGFLMVFGLFGLLTVPLASMVQRYLPYATVIIGVVLVALGIWLLSGRVLRLSTWDLPGSPTVRLSSMFGYGVGYAIASLSCTVGPFLAVTGSSFRTGGPLDGWLAYVAYAGGFGLIVGVLAIAVAVTNEAIIDRLRRILPYINRIGGAVLVLVGAYVAYYGYYEIRLFALNRSPDDPIINGAGRLQRALAGWVYQHGAWPWVLALGILALGLVLAWLNRRSSVRTLRDTRAGRAELGD